MALRYLEGVVTLELAPEKCTGCGICTEVCPHGVFAIEGKKARVRDRDACMECGACAQNCPAGALAVRAGVGCAAGIINGLLRGAEPACDSSSCCGGAAPGEEDGGMPKK